VTVKVNVPVCRVITNEPSDPVVVDDKNEEGVPPVDVDVEEVEVPVEVEDDVLVEVEVPVEVDVPRTDELSKEVLEEFVELLVATYTIELESDPELSFNIAETFTY
jgi:hypothetical protein